MRWLRPHLPAGSVPEILFEDRENCLFAMSAGPPEAETWKALLMRGQADAGVAGTIGGMLGKMVSSSWRDPEAERVFGDQTVFDQLRLDPYYRTTAARHPDLKQQFDRLMRESSSRRVSLVHGDWSPKNFLVLAGTVMAIMIIPIISSIAREVLAVVPQHQREAALALGATRWEVLKLVTIPFSFSGILGSVFLALRISVRSKPVFESFGATSG